MNSVKTTVTPDKITELRRRFAEIDAMPDIEERLRLNREIILELLSMIQRS